MSLFDRLVDQALKSAPDLSPLRIVVEKELLHHDILQVMSQAGLLAQLTFIGGTCLRTCYGSNRLSEDLDFTGGATFTRLQLADMGNLLVESLKAKYGLDVSVTEPVREEGNVDTWKLKVQTRPGRKDLPSQRINIDVCAIPSYQPKPMMLLNPYRIETGTSGLILQAQSREEIFVDKMLAFALRPNRIKNRDLWDIAWLHQNQIAPAFELAQNKLNDHGVSVNHFLSAFSKRAVLLKQDAAIAKDFRNEMSRFLPIQIVRETVNSDDFWSYLSSLIDTYHRDLKRYLDGSISKNRFRM